MQDGCLRGQVRHALAALPQQTGSINAQTATTSTTATAACANTPGTPQPARLACKAKQGRATRHQSVTHRPGNDR